MRVIKGRRILLSVLAGGVLACSADKVASPDTAPGRPFFSGPAMTDTLLYDSFTGSDGTNIVSHVAETGQAWGLNGGFTNKIKIQGNTAQLVSGADNNNWRMSVTTDVADDTFDLSADYKRGSSDVPGDYAQLEFLAQSGTNPPQDRVYIALTRTGATTVQVRLIRTKAFSIAQSIILDSAFPLSTGASKRLGVSVSGLQVQTWWEPAGGGTRTNIGTAVTLTQDYRDGAHKRVAFNFIGAQAAGAGSPSIDDFTVRGPAPAAPWLVLVDQLPDLDTSKVVTLPGDTFRLYRTDISMLFNSGVSDSEKAAFFSRHSISVTGVTQSGLFFVRIPDPGVTSEALNQAIEALRGESETAVVTSISRSGLEEQVSYRLPVDGPGQGRANWVPTSTNTWAMRAIRAPLAWGCETGAYDESRARVAIFEWKHQPTHPELTTSAPHSWEAPEALLAPLYQPVAQVTVDSMERHATATTGLLSAEGNNGSGIAGVNWRSRLYLYAGYSSGNRSLQLESGFYLLGNQIEADAPRVLSISADHAFPASFSTADRQARMQVIADQIQYVLDRVPQLLIVVAAGNERYRGTVANYAQNAASTPLRGALLLLRSDPQYRDRVIIVAGTYSGNNFWDIWPANTAVGSNFFTGVTDIAAPAQDITVLDRWTGQTGTAVPTIVSTGTSLSAPLVAGVAGLLLAMDSTRTAAQVKDYILRGARQPRLVSQTGQIALPQMVSGAPEPTYQVDAYGALTLLASEQQNIPLCGNRVWAAGGNVYAERDTATHTTEQLFLLNEPAAYVNVRHGGRRIELSAQSGDKALKLQLGHWVQTQDAATSPYGGTYLSLLQLSHDLDSAVGITPHAGDGFVDLDVYIHNFAANTNTTIRTIHVPLPSSGTYVCLEGGCTPGSGPGYSVLTSTTTADWRFAYSPLGDRVFVAVTTIQSQMTGQSGFTPCPWADPEDQDPPTCQTVSFHTADQGTAVHSINIQTPSDVVVWTVPGQVFWLASSEDGAIAVEAEGALGQDYVWEPGLPPYPPIQFRINAQPQVISGCAIVYRNDVLPGTIRHSVTSTDACQGEQGHGTIAPAPPTVGRAPR